MARPDHIELQMWKSFLNDGGMVTYTNDGVQTEASIGAMIKDLLEEGVIPDWQMSDAKSMELLQEGYTSGVIEWSTLGDSDNPYESMITVEWFPHGLEPEWVIQEWLKLSE